MKKPMKSISVIIWSLLMLLNFCGSATADFSKLIRMIGKVSDDVPLKRLDDVIKNKGTAEAGTELIKKNAKKASDATELAILRKKAWGEVLDGADPSIIRQFDSLPAEAKDAIYLISTGTRRVKEAIPDLVKRGDFIKDGGADVLAVIGRREDLLEDAIKFDLAVRAGKLPSPQGMQAITLNDWARFFQKEPSRSAHFWETHVRPHWGKWLVGTGLAAVILAPDEYLDAIGDWTKAGIIKIGTIPGRVIEIAITGVGTVVKESLWAIVSSFFKTFFSSIWGVITLAVLLIGLFAYLGIGRYLYNRIRIKFFGMLEAKPEK